MDKGIKKHTHGGNNISEGILISTIGVLKEIDETYDKLVAEITLKTPYEVGDFVIKNGVKWSVTKVTPRLEFIMGLGIMKLDVEWEKEEI
jgi:hypothetical protein